MANIQQQLKELIDNGDIIVQNKFIGCCRRTYIQLPKSKHKYYYNAQKPISKKLEKNFSLYNIYNTMNNNLNKNINANKIIKFLNTRLNVKTTEIKTAFKKEVIEVKIIPTYVGKHQKLNIEQLILNSYREAEKSVKDKNYSVSAYIKIPNVNDENNPIEVKMNSTEKKYRSKFYKTLIERIYEQLTSYNNGMHNKQSPDTIKNWELTFHFAIIPEGAGRATVSRDKLSILNKSSVNVIKNSDNNCFWYSLVNLVYSNHPKINEIKKGRKIRTILSMELCSKCEMIWNNPVAFTDIHKIEEKLNINIMILNIDELPILKCCNSIHGSLMYYNQEIKGTDQYWLLFDEDHYHSINNIRGFLAVDYFCKKCLKGFRTYKQYKEHECCEDSGYNMKTRKKKQNQSSRIGKDNAQYMRKDIKKGSTEEIEKNPCKEEQILYPDFISYDFESDTSDNLHKPNHVEADVLKISYDHDYKKSLIDTFSYNGYDVLDKFCEWLFTDKHRGMTVMAHNQSGYDGRFILQWCLKRGMPPSKLVRQGSKIMYMSFKKFKLRFIDTLNFFLEPLKNLSSTYKIDTLKGFFPHHFNTKENQNYVGQIPDENMFGVNNMTANTYENEFKPWYDSVKNDFWDFKHELIKYCRADVELLSKSILKFRKLFMEKLDVDPFRYITIASLCMSIYRSSFLPDNSIVSNESNKPISQVCKEYLIYLNNRDYKTEKKIVINMNDLNITENERNKDKLDDDNEIYYKNNYCHFVVDAVNYRTKTIKEFNGCFYHGCPKCHPECKKKYNKTIERKNILEKHGFKVEFMWECEWNKIKKSLYNKTEIEKQAKQQNIITRNALCGGRTEAFKSHFKCNKHQKIFYLDVCSLYPTVNALDDYAVGFKNYINITIDDIINDTFIGLVKCDIIPPKNLHIPVLPDNTENKLLFHLNPMYEKTWTTIELQKALEKGYTITKIHSAVEYKRLNGLMKKYVEHFIKMKIENNGVKTQTECDDINNYHKKLGFDFEIKPEETEKNPGLKMVAKICLNSLWGKFGQRSCMDSYDFYFDYNSFIRDLINNNKIVPQTWEIINESCVELRFTENENMSIEQDYISEITAVFTTSNARIRLYNMLDWLHHSQVIYCDTDSVIFVYDETNPEHKNPYIHNHPDNLQFGDGLGQWEDEFHGKDYIEEIVIGGAKSYAYKTKNGKTVIKQKGITLNRDNDSIINFNTMKKEILNGGELISAPKFQFTWDNKTKDVITKYISRSIRSTINEKRNIIGFDTLPFGFEN
jgi:hypothetical protein